MKRSTQAFLLTNAVLLVAFVLLGSGAILKFDWRRVWHELATASVPWVMLMVLAWSVALFVRPLRLLVLIRATTSGGNATYWPIWSADMIAMMINTILPARAGDMTMAFVLRKALGLRMPVGFSVVFIDRFFDLLTASVLFALGLSLAPKVAPWTSSLAINLPIGIIALLIGVWMAIALRVFWVSLLDGLLSRVAPNRRQLWVARARELFDGLAIVNRAGVVLPVLVLSLVFWGIVTSSYWFGAGAVWPDVSFAASAFAAGAVALSFVVPAPPGGVGVFHAAAGLALSLFGAPAEAALAAAIICHACQITIVFLLGFVALITQRISIRSLYALRKTDQ